MRALCKEKPVVELASHYEQNCSIKFYIKTMRQFFFCNRWKHRKNYKQLN